MVDVHRENNSQTVNVVPVDNTQNVPVQPVSTDTRVNGTNDKTKYYSDLAKHYAELAEDYADNADTSADNALESATSADTSADNAEVWAEGTDEEVAALGGTHSSKGWVNYVLTNPPTASVSKSGNISTLTVTDIDGTTTTEILDGADGQNGADGVDGQDGQDGADGFSPIATVTKSGDTATISITDVNGTTTATVSDGADGTNGQDGQDGYSPTATVTKTGNVATITLTDKNGTTTTQISDGGGASRNIGEIVTSTIPLTDAGLHLLDGTLLPYGVYKEFIDYIADLYAENPSANYFTTEAQWQQSVTTYGVCGKFVYDSTLNTVRLPKVSDILQGTTDVSALGDLVGAGIPNIIGYTTMVISNKNSPASSAFRWSAHQSKVNTNDGGSFWQEGTMSLDASRSSSIYGNSTTVQPQTIKVLYYVVIANSTKTEIQVDIDKIATDLNGKANVSADNFNATGTTYLSGLGMPSGSYRTLSLGASGATYTAPANGYFYFYSSSVANSILHNTTKSYGSTVIGASGYVNHNLLFVNKNDVVQLYYSTNSGSSFKFIYAKGSESEVQ